MNIVFYIGGLSGGGAERVVCNLATFLVRKGNDCTIVTMADDKCAYEIDSSVKRVVLLKNEERKNRIIDNTKRIVRLFRYVVHTHNDVYVSFLPITIILLLLFEPFTKAKVIVSERGDPNRYSTLIQNALKVLAKRADVWVFQTEDAKKWYNGRVKKAVVIPNAINPAFIGDVFQGERKKKIVGAGRLNSQKNFSMLIRAFAEISDENQDYSLTIYGEGTKREELSRLASGLGVGEKVEMPGYVSLLGEKIKDASLFVLSSNFEGMPNALMEAMALGLPCISTDCPVGGPKFLIHNGENGLLVPVNDWKALTQAIRTILNDPQRADEMGKKAHEICETLHPDKIYGQWESIIIPENNYSIKSRKL